MMTKDDIKIFGGRAGQIRWKYPRPGVNVLKLFVKYNYGVTMLIVSLQEE